MTSNSLWTHPSHSLICYFCKPGTKNWRIHLLFISKSVYNASSFCCIFSHSEFCFILFPFFAVTTATPSCSFSLPISPSYRPVSSILQCPDVLLSLRIWLHFEALLPSTFRCISLLGSSLLCRLLWLKRPVRSLYLTLAGMAEKKPYVSN